jgi:hypothetical protein
MAGVEKTITIKNSTNLPNMFIGEYARILFLPSLKRITPPRCGIGQRKRCGVNILILGWNIYRCDIRIPHTVTIIAGEAD